MIAVLGCLKTQVGLAIKQEMLSWLNPMYNVIAVDQEVPGTLYEYPAMQLAFDLSAKLTQPVLYLHTKGAANNHPVQEHIRQMWKNEFGNKEKLQKYLDLLTPGPKLSTILMSPVGKCTWFNAFICNPEAAIILAEYIHPSESRYDFECIARNTEVEVVSPFNPCENAEIFRMVKELKQC